MTQSHYISSGVPQSQTRGSSAPVRRQFKSIEEAFDQICQTLAPGTSDNNPASTAFVAAALVAINLQITQLAALINSSPGIAPAWVSGTNYAAGNQVYSPTNFQTYRRKTNGAGTTDPIADATNWQQLTGLLPFDDPAYWMNV